MSNAAQPPAADNRVEVFVDGKPVLVPPGITVLQVGWFTSFTIIKLEFLKNLYLNPIDFFIRLVPKLALKFRVSVITNDFRSQETVACVLLKLKELQK